MKLDELVQKYIEVRDRKALLKRAYDADVAKLDGYLNKMEAAILKAFQASGIDSARTDSGTAYVSTRTSATVADRDAFMGWVMDHPADRVIFLENRVSKTAVDQYKEANGAIPPGVNYRSEVVVGVRRS